MKRSAVTVSTLMILALTVALRGWVFAKVAEHPGMPRDVGQLPVQNTQIPSSPTPTDESTADDEYVQITGGEIEIALKEYELVPSKIMVRPGAYTFVLRNEGRFAHNFRVEGPGVDVRAAKFRPGRSIRVKVTLQEGEYKINCPLSNHDKRGMHGRVLVKS